MTLIGRRRHGIARLSFDLLLGAFLVATLLLPLGCSFSASSKSSSDSSDSSASSSGSSASSSPDSRETQYRNDVRDYTASYVKSGGRMEDFKRRLGELARERDVTNWEENTATYEGIGRGLGKAQASPVEVQTYTTNLAGSDPKKAEAIQKGYEAEKS